MFATTDKQSARASPFRERTELILSELDQLPTLPAVVARLITLTTSSKSTLEEIVEVIQSDAPLTAVVLRMVRRADLGVRATDLSVDRAVKVLGLNAVRNAAISAHVYEALNRPDDNEQAVTFHRELWKHSLAVACAADALAAAVERGKLAGPAFVCGLLHDLGKIALDAVLPKSYARVVEQVDRQRRCICDVEQEVLGVDHTVAGRHLATRWMLPRPIIDCIRLHHQDPAALPDSVGDAKLVQLVYLADNLVRRHHIGYSGYQHLGDVEAVAAELGLDRSAISNIMEHLPQRMEPLCGLLGLDDSIGRKLYVQSLTKANQELITLNEDLSEANRLLNARSACLGAVQRFTELLTGHDRIGDVCAAAAESACVLFQIDRALVFAADAGGPHLHVSAYQQDAAARISVNRLDDLGNRDLLTALARGGNLMEPAPAPPGCDVIWQRFMETELSEELWILPFVDQADVHCAALLVGRADGRGLADQTQYPCGPLSTAVGLAVATAKARTDAERLNDEALDLNRRCREAQRDLVRARSVSMIAQMAAGAAHELNNPLSVIRGRAQMQLDICDEPELARPLEVIADQADAASRILTELMAFAKPESPKPVLERLKSVLESHRQHWCAGSGVAEERLRLTLADEATTVYVDLPQFRMILDAVLTNAVEACPAESLQLQINSPSRPSDETVLISIKDNGPGMPAEVLEHAIDPFFSSRPAGRGRGLGLSRAYRLAEINGGCLWVDSTPDVGTTVTIELPARSAAPQEPV